MIVYGDLLFIENMIIGGVLLYLTGEICGWRNERQGRRRDMHKNPFGRRHLKLIAGSIMCGGFSLVIFWQPPIPAYAKGACLLLMEVIFAAAVCTVVFGKWRRAVVFILVTYFMGGMVMGLLLITKQQGMYTAAGIYTGDMKAAMLAVFICLGYMTGKQIIKTVRSKKLFAEHTYEAEIVIDEYIFKARAFLDTGNRLKDPITGKPAAVASKELWERICRALLKTEGINDEEINVEDFSECLMERYAIVPYEAVAAKGVLEGIRTDHIEVDGKRTKGCLIVRSERDIRLYDLLISGEMIETKF